MQKNILVIDDEMVMRSLVSIAMQRNGYTVVEAENPYKALAYLEKDTPDLIIMDMMMPGMSGVELCRRIRERAATAMTPIIVFSAKDEKRQIREALAAGATRYLYKLRPSNELIELVQSELVEAQYQAS